MNHSTLLAIHIEEMSSDNDFTVLMDPTQLYNILNEAFQYPCLSDPNFLLLLGEFGNCVDLLLICQSDFQLCRLCVRLRKVIDNYWQTLVCMSMSVVLHSIYQIGRAHV